MPCNVLELDLIGKIRLLYFYLADNAMQRCCMHVVLIDRMLAPLCKISYRLSFDYEEIRSGSGIYTI